jgi:uncharacterized protein YcfL
MLRIITPIVTLAALLALPACVSTAPPAAGPDPVSQQMQPQVLAQGALEGKLVTGRSVVVRTEGGAMSVSVPVRTRLQKDARVQYRFTFFDDRGRPLHPEPDWQYAVLPARTQMILEGASLQSEAADWRLEVRPAR